MAHDYAKQKSSTGGFSSFPLSYIITTFILVSAFSGFLYYVKSHPHPTTTVANSMVSDQKTVTVAAKKPRFDFYTILPKNEIGKTNYQATKEVALNPKPTTPALTEKPPLVTAEKSSGEKKPDTLTNYLLQIGSFQRYQDADNLRAKLTLQGFDVSIKTVNTQGKTFNRVLVGPFKTIARAESVQKNLANQKIKSVLFKGEG